MPRFYFHSEGAVAYQDSEGINLASEARAHIEALRASGDMMRDYARELVDEGWWRMTVTDEAGEAILVINFQSADPRKSGPPVH